MGIEEETTLEELEASEAAEGVFDEPSADEDIEVIVEGDEPETEPEPAVAPAPVVEEPPEPADSTVTDADLEAGDKAFPESFKRRIKREIRVRKKVQEEFEHVRGVAVQAVEYAQAKDQELGGMRSQIRELQKQHAGVLDLALDKDIALKRIALKAAREEGRADDEMAIQGELNTFQFQQNQIRDVRRTLDVADLPVAAPRAPAAAAPQPQQQQPRSPPPMPPLAAEWVTQNQTWFNNPEFVGHAHFARGVDTQLAKEGYDKLSPTYYAELNRRIDKAFPTLRKPSAASVSAPPVAPVGAGGIAKPANGAVRLNKIDLINMRRFGLDPSNKAHLREYAISKRSSA